MLRAAIARPGGTTIKIYSAAICSFIGVDA
jgi:hypothetical protein